MLFGWRFCIFPGDVLNEITLQFESIPSHIGMLKRGHSSRFWLLEKRERFIRTIWQKYAKLVVCVCGAVQKMCDTIPTKIQI